MIDNVITLTYGDLYNIVARSLSIIGKRANDEQGKNIFGTITLGTAERDIINDFFGSAFTEICATIGHFITTEISNTTPTGTVQRVDFWVGPGANEGQIATQVTASGQLLYNYETKKLRSATISYSWGAYTPQENECFSYDGQYYNSQGEQLEEPTAIVTPLDYYNELPTANSADLMAYYNGSVYKSVRGTVSFSDTTPSSSTPYYAPDNRYYRWEYGAMQYEPNGIATNISLTVTLPDNWNSALIYSLTQALNNYCVSYALFSWFTVTAPHISQKYMRDAQSQLYSILQMIHEKLEPEDTETSYVVSATVTNIPTTTTTTTTEEQGEGS